MLEQGVKVFLAFALVSAAIGVKYGSETCPRFKKIGCYKDKIIPNRPLPNELLNRRDPINKNWDGYMINWKDYKTTLHALHCKCGKLAKERGHSFFGLQFYGECWSGPNSYMFFRDGKANQQDCVGVDYKECDDEADTECIGKAFTNYIYSTETAKRDENKPIPGGWSDWSTWTSCTKSCAGGVRYRERTCTEPAPKFGGEYCEGEGEDAQACNTEKCEPVCKKELEVGVILDGSSSVTAKNWQKTLDFVKTFSKEFIVSPEEVHFGVIHFAWTAMLDFRISDQRYWTPHNLTRRIQKISYPYGGTRTDLAIEKAEQEFFCDHCGIRKNVPKILIVLTDGRSSFSSKPLKTVTQPLKDAGVTIMAIGVGQADEQELKDIATSEGHVFMLSEYKYLKEKVNTMLKIACNSKF